VGATAHVIGGVARFTDLSFTGPDATTFRLRFTLSCAEDFVLVSPTVFITTVAAVSPQTLSLSSPPPLSLRSGQPIAPPLTLSLLDVAGNPLHATDDTVTVHIARPDTADVTSPLPSLVGALDSRCMGGLCRFTDLRIQGPVSTLHLVFVSSSSGASVSSPLISLVPGVPTSIHLSPCPQCLHLQVAQTLPKVEMQVRDSWDNLVDDAEVHVASHAPPSSRIITPPSLSVASGWTSLSGVIVYGPAPIDLVLELSVSGRDPTLLSLHLVSGRPAALSLLHPLPRTLRVDAFFSPPASLRLVDCSGNTAVAVTVTHITASLQEAVSHVEVHGATATVAVGVADVSLHQLSLRGASVDGLALVFATETLSTVVSGPISLLPGDHTHVVVTAMPRRILSSRHTDGAFVVVLRDVGGNVATDNALVAVQTQHHPSCSTTLHGGTQIVAQQGTARFSHLVFVGPCQDISVQFSTDRAMAQTVVVVLGTSRDEL